MRAMESEELLKQWRTAVRVSHRAHADAASRCERLHTLLGLPAVALASILGTTILASLEASPGRTAMAAAGLAAVAVAVLAALQTFLGHTERAHRHREAAARYSHIQRELDELSLAGEPTPKVKKQWEELRSRWAEVDLMAPAVPDRQHKRSRDLVLGTREK